MLDLCSRLVAASPGEIIKNELVPAVHSWIDDRSGLTDANPDEAKVV